MTTKRGNVSGVRQPANSKTVCLVLGGNGFIGSHIVDKLAARPDVQVRVLDRFDTSAQFKQTPNITILKGSAFDEATLKKHLKGVDYVMHALSATNPATADTDPYADIENIVKSVKVFEQCVKAGVKKVAFISSGGAVYGSVPADVAATEHSTTPMPENPYGICKLTTEHYLEYFKHKFGLNYVVFRLSNPYGPRQLFNGKQGVIPAFMQRITNNEPIAIFGDGTASRDYIYIEDAAQMMADGLLANNKHAVYNIGSGKQTTLKEIVQAFEAALDKKAEVSYVEAPSTAPQNTDISIERFREEFGEPMLTMFHEGLAKTVEHLRRNQEIA